MFIVIGTKMLKQVWADVDYPSGKRLQRRVSEVWSVQTPFAFPFYHPSCCVRDHRAMPMETCSREESRWGRWSSDTSLRSSPGCWQPWGLSSLSCSGSGRSLHPAAIEIRTLVLLYDLCIHLGATYDLCIHAGVILWIIYSCWCHFMIYAFILVSL